MTMHCRGIVGWFLCAALVAQAQDKAAGFNRAVRNYVAQNRPAVLREFEDLLSIPNLAGDAPNIQKNADAVAAMCRKRGLRTQLLRVENAPPVVLAELPPDPSKRTVTFYAHYDGQPVNKADWTHDPTHDPWKPVLVDPAHPGATPDLGGPGVRIYARSASDDKAAVLGLLTALDALQASHAPSSVNLKFFFEGEEEAGSPHLAAILARYAGLLQSDLWVICDGPTYQDGQPLLVFGSRGVVTAQVTAFGPNRPLHSGHYGNWAPNPIVEIAHVISRLRSTDGRIAIPHFYEPVRPLNPSEQAALKGVPNIDESLKKEFGLSHTEGQAPLSEEILKPGLNLDRIEGGGSGPNAANAIPSSATAYIDFRMVPDQTPEVVKKLLEDYLRQLGYSVSATPPTAAERLRPGKFLQVTWGAGYPPQRTGIDAPSSQAFIRAAKTVTGDALVLLPTLGGSTPSFTFERQFNKPIIGLPIANYDNNQHAANENLKLQNLWDGIALYAGIYATLGEYWREP